MDLEESLRLIKLLPQCWVWTGDRLPFGDGARTTCSGPGMAFHGSVASNKVGKLDLDPASDVRCLID